MREIKDLNRAELRHIAEAAVKLRESRNRLCGRVDLERVLDVCNAVQVALGDEGEPTREHVDPREPAPPPEAAPTPPPADALADCLAAEATGHETQRLRIDAVHRDPLEAA